MGEAGTVARGYFGAIAAGNRHAQDEWYAGDMVGTIHGRVGPAGRDELIAYFRQLYDAVPDLSFEVLDIIDAGDQAAVHWRIRGTFAGPGTLDGLEPNGARLDVQGVDLVWPSSDGKVARIDAFTDNMEIARQLGAVPPQGSPAEQRLFGALNARTRAARRLGAGDAVEVADGVWCVQGQPGRCNVFLVRDGDGVLLFDAGAKTMLKAVQAAAAHLGGLTRVVLGHGHTDHRGTAPFLGVPVLCHPDEVADAEGSGGFRYWPQDLGDLPFPQRQLHRLFHAKAWDGGPVQISDTVAEGDDVAGFEVVHLPGHAPGLIALWRASDRLALCSDAFYTLDMWGRDSEPHLPLPMYNLDTEQARGSLRKLAALEPAAAWPGHAKPVTGTPAEVRARLEAAAADGTH
jgi:glyoxylase-like metal-dependent hydrolase (beta-lactamase superfamily II)/predicted ester cyclase